MLTHNKTPYPTLRGRVDFSRIWITDVWNSRYATACHFKTYGFIPDELLLETFFIRIHRGALHSSIITHGINGAVHGAIKQPPWITAATEPREPLLKFLSNFLQTRRQVVVSWHVSSNPSNISTRAIFLFPRYSFEDWSHLTNEPASLRPLPPPLHPSIEDSLLLSLILVGTAAACY